MQQELEIRCTGTSKRSGKRCNNPPMKGRAVCRMHGGKSLVGIASPQFTNAGHSKYLPDRLKPRYDEARSDSELLALREDIALIDARLSDLLSRVDTGESGALWTKLQKAWEKHQRAKRGGKPDRIRETEYALEKAIEAGATEHEAWGEIASHLEQRRKHTETERKRLVEMQQMVRSEEAMTFVGAVVASVQRHVHDRSTLAAISADIAGVTTRDAQQIRP